MPNPNQPVPAVPAVPANEVAQDVQAAFDGFHPVVQAAAPQADAPAPAPAQAAPAVPAAPVAIDFSQMSAEVLYQLKKELDAFIDASATEHLEMDQQDAAAMRGELTIRSCAEETYVIVATIHRDAKKNQLTRVKCHKGTPLGGYAYDNVNDSYCIDCIDHFALGLVPISFQIVLGKWASYVPIPESILVKYLSDKQKQHLQAYKANFTPSEDFTFEFLQLLH